MSSFDSYSNLESLPVHKASGVDENHPYTEIFPPMPERVTVARACGEADLTPSKPPEIIHSDVSPLRAKALGTVLNSWMQSDTSIDERSNGNTLILRRVIRICSIPETDILEIKPQDNSFRISWGAESDFAQSRLNHSIAFNRDNLDEWPNLKKALGPTLEKYEQWLKNKNSKASKRED